MGWSCSADASRTLQALEAFGGANYDSSNLLTGNTFFELDNIEHDDGRITGQVMSLRGGCLGDFEIAADGRITAMPTLDQKAFLTFCERAPRGQYAVVAALHKASPKPARTATYDVTVYACAENGEETNLGTVTLAAPNKSEAQRKAHDELWDPRLDAASCKARYELTKLASSLDADTPSP